MKKIIFALLIMFCSLDTAHAAPKLSYLEEVHQLGLVSGQGLACRAKKFHQYELLARAILVSKAPSAKLQKEAMRAYNEAKSTSFMEIYNDQFAECDQIVYNFNRQKIFKSVLYSDGRIKLHDGKMITPRKTYDAAKLYQKDPQVFEKAINIYKKSIAQAKKNSKNAKLVPMKDANYGKYANQL